MKPKFTLDFDPKIFYTLRHYNRALFAKDIMAGIIVGIVAIPLAIAFGIASGVGPTEGLVTGTLVYKHSWLETREECSRCYRSSRRRHTPDGSRYASLPRGCRQ